MGDAPAGSIRVPHGHRRAPRPSTLQLAQQLDGMLAWSDPKNHDEPSTPPPTTLNTLYTIDNPELLSTPCQGRFYLPSAELLTHGFELLRLYSYMLLVLPSISLALVWSVLPAAVRAWFTSEAAYALLPTHDETGEIVHRLGVIFNIGALVGLFASFGLPWRRAMLTGAVTCLVLAPTALLRTEMGADYVAVKATAAEAAAAAAEAVTTAATAAAAVDDSETVGDVGAIIAAACAAAADGAACTAAAAAAAATAAAEAAAASASSAALDGARSFQMSGAHVSTIHRAALLSCLPAFFALVVAVLPYFQVCCHAPAANRVPS